MLYKQYSDFGNVKMWEKMATNIKKVIDCKTHPNLDITKLQKKLHLRIYKILLQ